MQAARFARCTTMCGLCKAATRDCTDSVTGSQRVAAAWRTADSATGIQGTQERLRSALLHLQRHKQLSCGCTGSFSRHVADGHAVHTSKNKTDHHTLYEPGPCKKNNHSQLYTYLPVAGTQNLSSKSLSFCLPVLLSVCPSTWLL